MLLVDIRQYLEKRGTASLDEVAIHFDIATDAAKFALSYWVKKGKINILGAACSSSCGACGAKGDSYQWKKTIEVPIIWN